MDDTLQSKIVATAFVIAAESECYLIYQRTSEELVARKRARVKLGRPSGVGKIMLDQYQVEIEALIANGSFQKFIAQCYETSKVRLSRWIKKHILKKG